MADNNINSNNNADKYPKYLKIYDTMDFVTKMKAVFFYKVSIAMTLFALFLLISTISVQIEYYGELQWFVTSIIFLCIVFVSFAIYLLIKGKLELSIHMLLLGTLFGIWGSMFSNEETIISRLDTIALSLGILSMTQLIKNNNKVYILIYTVLNIAILTFFSFYIKNNGIIASQDIIDYYLDNLIACVFIATISYNTYIIYHNSLKRNELALKAAQESEEKVKILNEELEEKVLNRTLELNNALKIIEESNIELKMLNDSIINEAQQLITLNEKLILSEEKLSVANQTKDKFFAIIAHDLRGPFSGFLGLTDLMSKDSDRLSAQEMKRLSSLVHNSAASVYKLINDLLQWSEIQTGSIAVTIEYHDVYEICNNTISFLNQMAFYKNIEIIQNIKIGTMVSSDINITTTVFRNLLTNAIKFTARGGKIEMGIAELPEAVENSKICVFIKDSGIGMNDATIKKLFKLGQKVSHLGTEGESSTGLGLILCKEFINKQGGDIWVESEVGVGSTFFFTIPV